MDSQADWQRKSARIRILHMAARTERLVLRRWPVPPFGAGV
jgi:hypothetical protein